MDLSLDEVIKKTKSQTSRGGRGGRGGMARRRGRGNVQMGRISKPATFRDRPEAWEISNEDMSSYVTMTSQNFGKTQRCQQNNRELPDHWEHDMFEGGPSIRQNTRPFNKPSVSSGVKLDISNLEFGVTEDDIKELFSEFGQLKKVLVHYDRSGRSKGTAEVIYADRSGAMKAQNKYNNVPLDGRPMIIEMDDARSSNGGNALSMNSRLGSRPVSNFSNRGSDSRRPRGGGGRGRGRGQGQKRNPVNVSVEQLDAEMEEYRNRVS